MCSRYLTSQLDLDNCVDILSLADTFTLHRLKQSVFRFISENLKQYSSTAEFRAFTADQLASLLQANFPVNLSESDVLGAAAGWVEARPGERAERAHQVVEGVRLQEIPSRELAGLLERPGLQQVPCFRLYCYIQCLL